MLALAPIELSGTIVVVDASGRTSAPREGWIQAFESSEGGSVSLVVRDGAWRGSSSASARELRAYRCELDEREAVVVSTAFDSARGSSLELVARFVERARLEVAGADGAAVDGLEVVRCPFFPDDARFAHPVARSARSPVAIDPWIDAHERARWWPGQTRYWVRANGRAWSHVDLDPLAGGTFHVALAHAAALDLAFDGQLDAERTELVLEHASGAPRIWTRVTSRAASFASLPPGRWLASVQCDDGGGAPVVVGRAAIEAPGATTTRATLALDGPPPFVERSSRPVQGRIEVGPGWSERPSTLVVSRRGEPERSFAIDGAARFDAGILLAGAWTARVEPQGVEDEIFVLRTSRAGPSIELPPPCVVRVSARDADTGERVELERAAWSWRGTGARRPLARWLGGDFAGELPRGEIVVAARSRTHACRATRVQLDAESAHVVLEARRVRAFALALERGGRRVEFDRRWRVRAHCVDAAGTVLAQRLDEGAAIVEVDDGGRWLAWIDGDGAPGGIVTVHVADDALARATLGVP